MLDCDVCGSIACPPWSGDEHGVFLCDGCRVVLDRSDPLWLRVALWLVSW